jgi:hypothetical protein
VVLIVVSRWAGLEKVSASLVHSSDEKPNTKWSLGRVSGLDLCLSCNLSDQSLGRVVTAVREPEVEALYAHKLAQESGISCHARYDNSHMLIDVEDLLLMNGQIMGSSLKANKNLAQTWLSFQKSDTNLGN